MENNSASGYWKATLGLLTNFSLARAFVFGATRLPFWAELSSYAVIGIAGVGLTELVLFLGVGVVGLPLLIAKGGALGIVFFWNFFMIFLSAARSALEPSFNPCFLS